MYSAAVLSSTRAARKLKTSYDGNDGHQLRAETLHASLNHSILDIDVVVLQQPSLVMVVIR
jgi:hypothetical protein